VRWKATSEKGTERASSRRIEEAEAIAGEEEALERDVDLRFA
jgi:hypothetical protein